ncbi:baeRF2 domain-containing protein [Nesterenkonia flava]|uniref:Peptide chain release factor 1 n=1 Tax=Nesterenkonia flava TaxID=469799 RepID=A0ABU1FQE7_9MICC|nr:hypothetical protein [Nesterenkonia flava]MDR5710866.1 hypothetical protein [Nesterenkonia flava]
MQLSALRHIYEAEAPFATVYLEAQPASADAEQKVRLRWEELKSQLADAGAHEEALSALENAVITENPTAVQTEGRVLVANRTGLLLEEDFDATGAGGDHAELGEPAQLGDYLRQRLRSVRMLVAVTDQEQAVLRRLVLTSSDVLDTEEEQTVEGSAVESVHKPRGQHLKHRQIQNTADEAAKQNIRDVLTQLKKTAQRFQPDVVVLAGEVQGRRLLHNELPHDLQQIAHEVESGGGIAAESADEGAEQALSEDLSDLARQITLERTRELTDRYREARAHNLAVEGAENIRRAVQLGAVETLLLRYDERAQDEDQLLQAAASVDAAVGLVGTGVADQAAAILRYEAPVDQMDTQP